MITIDKTFDPNGLNDYKMTPLELAIQCGEAQLVKDIANHPDFDYKQHRPSMFLQILEKSSDAYFSPKKVEETKSALKEVVLHAIEKNPTNFGHYTPGFLRDDKEVVLKAISQDVNLIEHASIRLREDKQMKKFITVSKISAKHIPNIVTEVPQNNDMLDLSELTITPVIKEVGNVSVSKNDTLERIKSTREKLQQSVQSNTFAPR